MDEKLKLNLTFFCRVRRQTESGLWSRMFDCTERAGRASCRASKVSIFESLDEYVSTYSSSSDLSMNNFHLIFLYYFLFCSLIFVAFCLHHLVKFIKRRAIIIRSTISHYLAEIRLTSRYYLTGIADGARRLARCLSNSIFKLKVSANDNQ